MRIFFFLVLISLISLFLSSCKEKKEPVNEWFLIRNKGDFSEFMTYAYKTRDTTFLRAAYDSITAHIPAECCVTANYINFYDPLKDLFFYANFELYDECEPGKRRLTKNSFVINIDSLDRRTFVYNNARLAKMRPTVLELFASNKTSVSLPDVHVIPHADSVLLQRKLFFDIYISKIDNKGKTCSWSVVLSTVREIVGLTSEAKRAKAEWLYHTSYSNLSETKRRLVDKLVITHIKIHFCPKGAYIPAEEPKKEYPPDPFIFPGYRPRVSN